MSIFIYENSVLEVEPDREEAVLQMANLYNQLNETEKAVEIVDRYIASLYPFLSSAYQF